MNNSASASRRTWNRVMNALVWASAVLVIVLVAGILGMVLVRGMDFYVPFCVSMLIVIAGHGVSYVRRQRKRA